MYEMDSQEFFVYDMLNLNEKYVKLIHFPVGIETGITKECENNDEKYYDARNGA